MANTHTDDVDNPIPITFDLTLVLMVHQITNTYSPIIQDWLERHPIRVIERQNPPAIEPHLDLKAFGYNGLAVESIYGATEDSLMQKTLLKLQEDK